jgi:hypothetical protein
MLALKSCLSIGGLLLAGGSFWWNSNMPNPVGPVPFFAGVAAFLFAIIFL